MFLFIPVILFLAGWLFLHLGCVMAGTVLLRLLQILISIAAVILIVIELAILNDDDSGFFLKLLGLLATVFVSCGMIWICDRIFQEYGITTTFVSGFIEVVSVLLEMVGD